MADTLGKRIKETRQRLGLVQDRVSEAAGLSKGFYSDVENDKGSISVENLMRISDALNVSIEWLIRGHKSKRIKCPLCGKGTITL